MIYDKIEDTPGYAGLYGEVVTEDCYKLRELKFVPDVIIDLGANIGVFTKFARELFPDATIIAVEPNPTNFEHLNKFADSDKNIIYVNAAIGNGGQLWHNLGAVNGSGESYVSSGTGFYHDEMEEESQKENGRVEKSRLTTILLRYFKPWITPDKKVLFKIDIEGGEHALFDDGESMQMLYQADYVCAELHLYALRGGDMYDEMAVKMGSVIGNFMKTHSVKLDNVQFCATKNAWS